jgi:hypothetical protein
VRFAAPILEICAIGIQNSDTIQAVFAMSIIAFVEGGTMQLSPKITKQQLFALDSFTETKHFTCVDCSLDRITSKDEVREHRELGHAVVSYCPEKASMQLVN